MQLKNVSPFLLGWYRLGKTPKLGFQKAYLIFHISFRKGHPYYTPKLQASAQRLFSRCCLLLAGSKISLSPLLPVSILIDSLLPSRKRLVRPLLCCILWSSASVCVFSDSRDPTLISDWNVSSRFWATHLVSSAITAGSPCGCSAAYSPSAYLTLPNHLFYFIFDFPFLHFSFYL